MIYRYMHDYSDEFLANLNAKPKRYRIGTVIVCANGIRLVRVRGKFIDMCPKGLKYLMEGASAFQVLSR